MENKIYLDNAATTFVSNEVLAEMMPVFTGDFGNASSFHAYGRSAEGLVAKARARVAKAIGAKTSEIIFTSGATEANNLAIIGIAKANAHKGKHIITTQIEHPSVLQACKYLEGEGFEVTYLPVDEQGMVSMVSLLNALRADTTLVSIMFANNEVGTIQYVRALSKIVHDKNAFFHTDAVQAIGCVSIDVEKLGVDALSISAHKIYGPKGVGALYLKSKVPCFKQSYGGGQEKNLRSGTLNVPGIVGLGKAIEVATRDMIVNNQKNKYLKDYFIKQVNEKIENVKLNGHPIQRLSNNINLSFEFVEGEAILMRLDMVGVCVSTGSACASGSLEPSHVLTAMGIADEIAQGSVRFTLGKDTTKQDIDFVVENLVKIVADLRAISPLTKKRK